MAGRDDEDDLPAGVRKALERVERDRTPPMGVAWDADQILGRMYRIAEEVVRRERAGEWQACESQTAGPVCKVIKRIEKTEGDMEAIKEVLAEQRGAAKRNAVIMAMLVPLLAAAATLVTGMLKRDASAQAAAQTMQVVTDLARDVKALRAERAEAASRSRSE